jgi:hypothetical protein
MITIYTIAYNEEIVLPFMIKWYRDRFPNCKIVVYDNYSTDNTEKIALENNCEVIKFDTNNEFRDDIHMQIKNTCWKDAKTDWVITCDTDELLNIDSNELKNEQDKGTTIIKTLGWNMVNLNNKIVFEKIEHGFIHIHQSKKILFNKSKVKEMNYDVGAHNIKPKGVILYSEKVYNLCHFKYLSGDYLVERYKTLNSRLSQINIRNRWGTHYNAKEENLRTSFENSKKGLTKIL